MAGNSSNISKPSYFYSIVSITLVLFIIGLLGITLIQIRLLSAHFKENIEITLIVSDKAAQTDIDKMTAAIGSKNYVKSIDFVSKEAAAEVFQKKNNENFEDILGYNPLFSSFNLKLHANYTNTDSLDFIITELESNKFITESFYQASLIDVINENSNKIGLILGILSLIFFVVAFTLIDNTIKLAMYSNRFLIKSMQLVGATRSFITKPFTQQAVYNGIISGMLASVLLVLLLLFAQQNVPELSALFDIFTFLMLCICLILAGILISWWSTKSSVTKYLQMHLDELY